MYLTQAKFLAHNTCIGSASALPIICQKTSQTEKGSNSDGKSDSAGKIRPWPLRWVLGQGSLLPLSQGEAFTLASISYLAILVKYILAKKKIRAGPRRANISWIRETKHHMNRKTNRTKLLETKTGLRVNKVHRGKLQSSTTERAWAPDAANGRPSKGESQAAENPGDNTAVNDHRGLRTHSSTGRKHHRCEAPPRWSVPRTHASSHSRKCGREMVGTIVQVD